MAGDKSSQNADAEEHTIVHGAGKELSDHVARADKTAPLPEPEKGEALEGFEASATGIKSGADSEPAAAAGVQSKS